MPSLPLNASAQRTAQSGVGARFKNLNGVQVVKP